MFEWSSVLPFMRPGGVLVADDVHRNHGLTTFRNRTSRAGCSLGSLQTDKASSRSPRLRLAEPLVSLTGVRSLGDRLPRPVAEAPPPRRAADPTCGRGRSSAQTSPCGLVVDNQLALVLSSDDVETSLCEPLLKEPEQQPEHRSNGSTSNGPAAGSCASDHLQGLIGRLPGRILRRPGLPRRNVSLSVELRGERESGCTFHCGPPAAAAWMNEERKRQGSSDSKRPECDVAVIGAGPYGLSAAAHLAGLDVRVFGRKMSFWREHMPRGMLLRSPRSASSLSSPNPSLRLEDYEREIGGAPPGPVPLETFVAYGDWFQGKSVPLIDTRDVQLVQRDSESFALTLEDGEVLRARRVVVAAGIEPFAWLPPEFASLSPECVSHSVDHGDLGCFAGVEVCVVGAGQSAIESAALLHEAGAKVQVVARAESVNWLLRSGLFHRLGPLRSLFYAPSDVGPAAVSWLIHLPGVFRRIPRRIQDPLAERSIRPAASAWLVPRVADVSLVLGRQVVCAADSNGRVRLNLDDGTVLSPEHVLLATGYRVDIARYVFLDPSLLKDVNRVDGFPRLGPAFESSVPGLHFLGAAAAWSYGPLFRFVAGAEYAAPKLAQLVRAKDGRIR